jgi:hypothetical protein
VAPTGNVPSLEVAQDGTRVNQDTTVRSKILSHFVKGKISLSPMETILMIPGELGHLESLIKIVHRKKDAELVNDQVSVASPVPASRRICVNKTSRSKTLHLSVEINRCMVEKLVDIGASMSVMVATVVWEMGMMHLVVGSETYKTASRVVTHALRRIDEVSVVVGGVQCTMIFMAVDTNSYDVLLGLDFLMKIGAIVDVERGLIQVRKGLGTNMEVLPLIVVNLLQNVRLKAVEHDAAITLKNVSPETLEVNLGKMSLCDSIMTEQTNMPMSESDTNTGDDSEEELKSVEPIEGESEFEDTELEELVLKEGPQQILQLTLQDQADDFMKEEISDSDDYADWIQWVSDAEEGKQTNRELVRCAKVPTLLQIHQMSGSDTRSKQLALSSDHPKMSTRWEEISQKIRIDHNLGEEKKQQLWKVLNNYQDVFDWNKGELGCCTVGEHSIDTQGFPPCRVSPGRLSFWEEAEVKRQIDVLVELGKMKPSDSEYACHVTLPMKRDGSKRFCGDYRPLNR